MLLVHAASSQCADFELRGTGVEEQVQSLPGGELAFGVLLVDAGLSAAQPGSFQRTIEI